MEVALYDPESGYYQRRDLERWGRNADYRTSPERSELFAATCARYFANLHHELGDPEQWTIREGGFGDGRFALGVLSALSRDHSHVFSATRYVLEEVSADAVSRARAALSDFQACVSFESPHANGFPGPWLYFSNELLDSFPVHRVKTGGELYVTLDSDGKFAWTTGPLSTNRLARFLDDYSIKLEPNQIIEINLAIDDWLEQVAKRPGPGYVITVDYGAESADLYDPYLRPEGTLRGFSRQGFVADVLAAPGEYDITSSVNWTQVKRTGARLGLKEVEFASQDRFLLNIGLLDQLQLGLQREQSGAGKARLTTDAREMILPGGMAASFQVLVQKSG